MKTSKPDLESLINTLKAFNHARESESSWSEINNSLAALAEKVVSSSDAIRVLDALHPLIQTSMLSDRSRLSGSSLLLLKTCTEKGACMSNHIHFISTLFKLVNRPLKVFSQRAEEVLLMICKLINVDRHVGLFKEMFKSVNKSVRVVVMKAVKHSSHAELRALVEKARTDASAEVRGEVKEYYSPLRKTARAGVASVFGRGVAGAGTQKPLDLFDELDIAHLPVSMPLRSTGTQPTSALPQNMRGGPDPARYKNNRSVDWAAARRREVLKKDTHGGVDDNLTPRTLSKYLQTYKENVHHTESVRSLVDKMKKREDIMKELESYRKRSIMQTSERPDFYYVKGQNGVSAKLKFDPRMSSIPAASGVGGMVAQDIYSDLRVSEGAGRVATDSPSLKKMKESIWTTNSAGDSSALRECVLTTSTLGSEEHKHVHPDRGVEESSVVTNNGLTPPPAGESWVDFLTRTGNKLLEGSAAFENTGPVESNEPVVCALACMLKTSLEAELPTSDLNRTTCIVDLDAEMGESGPCVDGAFEDISPEATADAANEPLETELYDHTTIVGAADEGTSRLEDGALVSECHGALDNATRTSLAGSVDEESKDATSHEDEGLSCDISRLSLHDKENPSSQRRESTKKREKRTFSVIRRSVDDVHATKEPHVFESESSMEVVVQNDDLSAVMDPSQGENIDSTEFTEIDSVVFANKKTMSRK